MNSVQGAIMPLRNQARDFCRGTFFLILHIDQTELKVDERSVVLHRHVPIPGIRGPHETSWICTGAQNRITFDPAQSCADAIGLLRRRVCREDVRVVERGQTSDTRAGPLTFY